MLSQGVQTILLVISFSIAGVIGSSAYEPGLKFLGRVYGPN